MDAFDLFKKLSAGTKFDKKRFQSDTERFQITKKPIHNDGNIKANIKLENNDLSLSNKRKRENNEENEETEIDNNNSEHVQHSLNLFSDVSLPNDDKKCIKKKKIMTEDKKHKLEQEKLSQFRNKHGISVIGQRIPNPIASFNELAINYNIAQDLIQNIEKCGYETPTPIQMQAIPILLENRQILACAPTGSGKTLAFILPILHHLKGPRKLGFRAIILSPTRELAKQTYRECVKLSEGRDFRVHIISKIKQSLEKYGSKSSQQFDILITTPKRLEFLLKQDPPAISLKNVEWLIIDEADKLFEDGTRSFRDQLEQISKACSNEKLCRAMFSATNTKVVIKWCRKNLKGLVSVAIGNQNAAAELVEQELLFVGSERGKLVEFRNIINRGMSPPVLVFVQSKERAQELFNELIYDGINVDVIHADRTQLQRDNTVKCFREGKIWVLICTELMGRGIDFKGVNLVINYDFPPSTISYIHRIGRTGRAGRKGKAITFFTEQDTANLPGIAAIMRASGCNVPEYMLTMKKHRKIERKKLEKRAPKRDTISTILKRNRRKTNQQQENKSEQGVKVETKEKNGKRKKISLSNNPKLTYKTGNKKNKKFSNKSSKVSKINKSSE
ncbi:hypothetical protein PV325_011346 [Microctonus aethiopoides]|uniref:Probable ATP-dependent RNA helicase DDX52 n=1 Tax=Microctonus aethiopoides TaxID=144406 RepID=A0AA39C4D1_9HYME|nr:hypothetical protein PV325_011346 [Microctonus aethiopoides]KAK0157657.1 hypothetical protein PV328_011368 [Microctonus aethiopoides]